MRSLKFGAMATWRDFEAAAIDQERMPGDAAAGDILIHHPAAHADEVVFGPLADLGDLDRIERQAAFGEERVRARDFERGRGAQARADRDVGPDDEIGAGKARPLISSMSATPRT